ncbi:hypothetical protein SAMN03159444_04603 [Pseudomonas sp. NFACC02]|nr:hypothetical protein SAMN03159444_04603 [Pseudomonas sp. NFACC02]
MIAAIHLLLDQRAITLLLQGCNRWTLISPVNRYTCTLGFIFQFFAADFMFFQQIRKELFPFQPVFALKGVAARRN